MSKLALLGGEKAVKTIQEDMFAWPIINEEMIDLVSDTGGNGLKMAGRLYMILKKALPNAPKAKKSIN